MPPICKSSLAGNSKCEHTFRILFCCNISREMFKGKSSLSTIPLTKPRYSGIRSSQLSMMKTRRTYSLMLFCFFLVSNRSNGARLQQQSIGTQLPKHCTCELTASQPDTVKDAATASQLCRICKLQRYKRANDTRAKEKVWAKQKVCAHFGTYRTLLNSSWPSMLKCLTARWSSQSFDRDL